MNMLTSARTVAGRMDGTVLPGRAIYSRNPLLLVLLVLLGLAVLSTGGTAGDNEKELTQDHPIQGSSEGGVLPADNYPSALRGLHFGDDYPSGFQGKHGAIVRAPLARMHGEYPYDDSTTAMTKHPGHEIEGSIPVQHQVVSEESGRGYSREVMFRRMEEGSQEITTATLEKISPTLVIPDEGLVFCPIPKVSSSEWKRVLRWMLGDENWDVRDGALHQRKANHIPLLAKRGLEDTRWAMETDRILRFVVVRNPAERLLSAFLDKCVRGGYESNEITTTGSPNCSYLKIMPELFPGTKRATLLSHARLKELVETDPYGTFYHFASGIWREVENHGDPCKISNVHHRPQACFCNLKNMLPAFYVARFSNLSSEAEALAGRLPAAMSDSDNGVDLETFMGIDHEEGLKAPGWRTGVTEGRREEIRVFFKERFGAHHEDVVVDEGTKADNHMDTFVSDHVIELLYKMYKIDYDLLAQYV